MPESKGKLFGHRPLGGSMGSLFPCERRTDACQPVSSQEKLITCIDNLHLIAKIRIKQTVKEFFGINTKNESAVSGFLEKMQSFGELEVQKTNFSSFVFD